MSASVRTRAPASSRAAFARCYLTELRGVLEGIPIEAIADILEVLGQARAAGAQIFLVGNGGSAATASHMANDLSKTVAGAGSQAEGREGFRTIALTDNVPLLTAYANDVGYEEVFAGQLKPLARSGDVLIVISGSGNSPNLVRAVEAARTLGMRTIGLLGRGGGALSSLVETAVVVPADDYGPIEDAHLAINHLITAYFHAAQR